MKILMIGGTGTISSAITRQLAAAGHEVPAGVRQIICDIDDEKTVLDNIQDEMFDVWCDRVIEAQEAARKCFLNL